MQDFLTPEERQSLLKQHRAEKNRRVGDRIKAVILANDGWTYRVIAKALLLDEETVSQHVNDYLTKDKKLNLASGGSESYLNADQTKEFIQYLETHTYIKVQEICGYVKEKYDADYTLQGMTSWLHSHKFSYKKPKGIPAKADEKKQKDFIEFYANLVATTPDNEPIEFGDGVHPTMATKLSYGWIRTGTDKLISTTASRTRVNVMGSINLKTLDVTFGSHDTINSDSIEIHLAKLREKYPDAPKIHLILDQGSYNTSLQTKEAAEKVGIVLHHLPPYSPNLNPIERLWKIMNEHVRNNRFFNSPKEFRESINAFFETTWPKNCAGNEI